MRQQVKSVTTAARLVLTGCFLVMLAGFVTNSVVADFGVPSDNPADRPPSMNPDVESRTSDPDRPPSYGPEDAKVLIVLFSDYQCPSCRRITEATHQISAEFPGDVRIEVWHLPLDMHKYAEVAAIAAIAAQNQGRFWEMHDLIFEQPGSISEATLEEYAIQLGLDMDKFRADTKDPAIKERINKEKALAVALGVQGTPGLSINGKVTTGWASWPGFRSGVAEELEAAEKLAAQGMNANQIREQRALDNLADSESYEAYRANLLTPSRATE